MKNTVQQGKDLHKELASQLFGIPIDEVTPEQRAKAKAYNFMFLYGCDGAQRRFSDVFRESKQ